MLAKRFNFKFVLNLVILKYLKLISGQLFANIPDTIKFNSKYDFIIIGAGSAGSVIANRLSENHTVSILLLEAGDQENDFTDVPLTATLTSITRFNWGYQTQPTPNACRGHKNGRCSWPKGKGIGGSSLINFMIYSRGHKRDYDHWAEVGNTGWSYNDVLPYFRKSENIGIPELRNSFYHGQNGPLDVQYPRYKSKLVDAFLKAGKDMGYNITDPNGEQMMGYSRAQANLRNGRRCSTGKAFILPIIHRKNLHISMKSTVTKILIDPETKEATGVEFFKNGMKFVIGVNMEVILSAGAIASPQLLMLSGVGPRDHLKDIGINVIQDLKVGYNLQDHISIAGLTFLVNQSVTIIESEIINPYYIFQYLVQSNGPYTLPGGAEAYGFIRTAETSISDNNPDVEIVFGPGALSSDISGALRNLLGITDEFYQKTYKDVIGKHAYGLVPILLYPKSRGRISLESKNPFHWPKMEPNYMHNPDDVIGLIRGIKAALDLSKSKHMQKFGTQFHTTPYLGCENEIFGSDEYWECCIRRYSISLQHQSGTCKMGLKTDPEAVVNNQLQVHDLKRLRVIDASIIPLLPAGHTNAIVIMIAEKGADMIKEYWNL